MEGSKIVFAIAKTKPPGKYIDLASLKEVAENKVSLTKRRKKK